MAAAAAGAAAEAAAPSSDVEYVKLISSDKHTFIVEKKIACLSGFIRTALGSGSSFREASRKEVELPEIPSAVLQKTIEYMHYKHKHNNSRLPIPEFDIPAEMALELLRAANYLDI